jgi:p-cumate 2,3-dioxygenase subunit alpha
MEPIPLEPLVLDNREAGLFRVNRRVFTEPTILEWERERIFQRGWIYAGHESEIPRPGDFRSRRVAGRPLILVRGQDGHVRALLNTCTHRGTLVCREQAGNAKTFQCPYHAWTYDTHGALVGVPGDDAYSEAFDRKELALRQAPRLESYRGFVFVSFTPAGEGLVDYLAGAKEYLDLVYDQSEVGMEIVEGTQAYSMRANWKLLVENSIDGYHALSTHQRYLGFLGETGINLRGGLRLPGGAKTLGNGHAVIEYDAPWGRPVARWAPRLARPRRRRSRSYRRSWKTALAQSGRTA